MKLIKVIILFFLICTSLANKLHAQYLPVSNSYEPLYDFIEELRADNYISLDQFYGPLSEKQIAVALRDAIKDHRIPLRVKAEIGHYQREFYLSLHKNRMAEEDIDIFRNGISSLSLHPMGFYWGDEFNTFSINPIGGLEWTMNNDNNSLYYHKGVRVKGNIGSLAYYAKIHDQTHTTVYNQARYINNVRNYNHTAAFTDMLSGGISYANNWLMLGVFHDKNHLGSSINSPVLISHRSPNFSNFKLSLSPTSWLNYNFMLAYLGDIAENRNDVPFLHEMVYSGSKVLAMNQIELKPVPSLGIAFGQLSTFAQGSSSWYNYLPLNYYKDVPTFDPVLYYHINLASIPHLDLSFTHFFERFSMERLTYKEPKNHAGIQTRAVLSNWPLTNLILRSEYTYVSPFALGSDAIGHQHLGYPLGWYLGDHSDRLALSMTYKPVYNFQLTLSYEKSRKGDYENLDISTPYVFTPFESLNWQTSVVGFQFRHQTSYFTELFAGIYSIQTEGDNVNYRIAPFEKERTFSFNIGFKIGY